MLEIKNVTVNFGGLKAVDNMEMCVEKGSIHSLIGPNGAGKTTLFNVITRVIEPANGSISFKGDLLLNCKAEDINFKGITRTFQNLQLFQGMTVYDNIYSGLVHKYEYGIFSLLIGKQKSFVNKAKDRVHAIAEILQIKNVLYYYPSQLSYGILKRVEIARAIISDPEILLLDEPAAGLNLDETSELDEVLTQLNNQGKTILLVEHDMNLVMKISHKISVMNFGTKIAEGTPSEVANNKEVIKVYLGEDEDA